MKEATREEAIEALASMPRTTAERFLNSQQELKSLKALAEELAGALEDVIEDHTLDCDCWQHQVLAKWNSYKGGKGE